MKKVFEKIIEGMLTCSGFVTSITILLIVLFLFTEAFGLFKAQSETLGDCVKILIFAS